MGWIKQALMGRCVEAKKNYLPPLHFPPMKNQNPNLNHDDKCDQVSSEDKA